MSPLSWSYSKALDPHRHSADPLLVHSTSDRGTAIVSEDYYNAEWLEVILHLLS